MWDREKEPLYHFHFWSVTKSYMDKLTYDELDELEEQLSEFHPEPWEDMELNNYICNHFEEICADLGLYWQDVLERGN